MAMKEEIETRNVAEMAQSENRQAVEEIVITPEMIEAGVSVLLEFDHDWSNPKEYAGKIFRSMESAARREEKSIPVLSR